MFKIFQYSWMDVIRSRWTWAYTSFFVLLFSVLLFIGGGGDKAILGMMNGILFLIPLISLVYAMMYFYQVREYVEVLLAQPISRKSVFTGFFLGVSMALCTAVLFGLAIPTLFGFIDLWSHSAWFTLVGIGLFLTVLFTALALNVVLKYDNRLVGFGVGLLYWILLAVVYDGVVLLFLVLFEGYPMETPTLLLTVLNPIDLARILLMFQLDYSALMGFTGAVFTDFFTSFQGVVIILTCFALWLYIPIYRMLRRAKRRDF